MRDWIHRRWKTLALVATGLLTFLWSRPVLADNVDRFVQQLKTSSDAKVRLSAALSLAKLGESRAIPALLAALKDDDQAVRGVAAASLGKLISANSTMRSQVLSGLTQLLAREKSEFVKKQAQRSLDAIAKGSGSTAESAPSGGIYVNVGVMAAKVGDPKVYKPLMRTAAQSVLDQGPFVSRWPGGGEPTSAMLQSKKMKAFYLDGSVSALSTEKSGSATLVSCEVSMLLASFPERSMFGFLTGSGAVETGNSTQEIEYGKQDCVKAVVEDVMARKIIPTIRSRAQ